MRCLERVRRQYWLQTVSRDVTDSPSDVITSPTSLCVPVR